MDKRDVSEKKEEPLTSGEAESENLEFERYSVGSEKIR